MVVITWKVLTTWKVPTLFRATTLEALLFYPVVSNGLSYSKTFSSVILKYVQKLKKCVISAELFTFLKPNNKIKDIKFTLNFLVSWF